MDRETFRREIEIALSHLRDVVRLRTMELGALLLPGVPQGQRGWDLSGYLLQAVQKLRPAEGAGDDWPCRRYELLALRYVNGLSPDEVAVRLAISSRHVYRQTQRALDEFANYLWAEVASRVESAPPFELPEPPAPATEHGHLDLLRQELMPLLQSRQRCRLADVWQGVFALLSRLPAAPSVSWQVDLPVDLPEVALSAEILKQFLLGLAGDLLRGTQARSVALRTRATAEGLELAVFAQRDEHTSGSPWESIVGRAGRQPAILQGARLTMVEVAPAHANYQVILPTVGSRKVLVVEDNEEVCLLFQRYLKSGGYQPLVATAGAEAVALARPQPLYAVTLDLMMNDEDGWDVLQALRDDPQTCHLPIVVCSVLDQQDLALMLGATAFLKKPVMCEQLLQALSDLAPTPPNPQSPALSP